MVEYFRVSVADKNIEIECHNRTIFSQCKDYLSDFNIPDLTISTTMQELETEVAKLPFTEEKYEGVATSRFYGTAESIIVCKKIATEMLCFDTFLMHGAVVAHNNIAYMFTAPSGVGKSTRAKLWLTAYPDSIIVNGDKPFIRITATQAIACGTPWCGKEGWNTNTMVPLKAIFLLERVTEDEKTTIEEVTLGKAFPFMLQQTYRPTDVNAMRKTIELLKALDGKVKFYKFRSEPTLEAIRFAYKTAQLW